MIQALRHASIAHGDLQHGNVLVGSSGLKLVDYDGMFVPALLGKRGTELGQPNYQHPRRADVDFGPSLDSFSAWVIYVSIVALSIYPNLWQTFRGGDDCLLFRRADFEDPDSSRVIRALEHCQNQSLRDLVEFFKIALYSSPATIPDFDNAVPVPLVVAPPEAAPRVPSWLQDHLTISSPSVSRQQDPAPGVDQSWVLDFMASQTPPPAFTGNVAVLRLFFWCSALAAIAAFVFSSTVVGLASSASLAVSILVCFWRFKTEAVVRARAQSLLKFRNAEKEIREAHRTLEEVDVKKRSLLAKEDEDVNKLKGEIQEVAADEKKQCDAAERTLRQATASAMQTKHRIDQQEASELQQIHDTLGTGASKLAQQIAQSQQAEVNEVASALKAKQQDFIRHRLEAVRLSTGTIPGIGTYIINNLIYAGIRTAADCNSLQYKKVPSVGPRRVSAILAWRQQLEAEAQKRMPKALTPQEESAIRSKYIAPRAQLQSQMTIVQETMVSREAEVRQRHASARAPIDSQIGVEKGKEAEARKRIQAESRRRQDILQEGMARAQQRAKDAIAELEKPVREQRQALQSAQWKVAKARIESGRYRKVTFGRYVRHVAIGR
jgi:hypothetical protein